MKININTKNNMTNLEKANKLKNWIDLFLKYDDETELNWLLDCINYKSEKQYEKYESKLQE